MSLHVLIYTGEMDETSGTPLLEMKNMEREKSINNPHLKSKKNVFISPLIRYGINLSVIRNFFIRFQTTNSTDFLRLFFINIFINL